MPRPELGSVVPLVVEEADADDLDVAEIVAVGVDLLQHGHAMPDLVALAFAILPVGREDLLGLALPNDPPLAEQQQPIGQRADLSQPMGGHEDRALLVDVQIAEVGDALAMEVAVAHRQHLVDEEDVEVGVQRDGEAQAHPHARGVGLDRTVEGLLQIGEVDDLRRPPLDLLVGHAQQPPDDLDVGAARQLGLHPHRQIQQGRDPPLHRDLSRGGGDDSSNDAEQRALAGAVVADDPDALPLLHLQIDLPQGPDLLGDGHLGRHHPHQGVEGRVIDPVALGDVLQAHRGHVQRLSPCDARRRETIQMNRASIALGANPLGCEVVSVR